MKLSNNEVTLTGFTGGNAIMKETKNGKKFTRIGLATSECRKNRETGAGTNTCTWHFLGSWGKLAEAMNELTTGSFIQVRRQ